MTENSIIVSYFRLTRDAQELREYNNIFYILSYEFSTGVLIVVVTDDLIYQQLLSLVSHQFQNVRRSITHGILLFLILVMWKPQHTLEHTRLLEILDH